MKSRDFLSRNKGIFRLGGLSSLASGKVPDERCAFTCNIFYLTCVPKVPPTKSISALKQKHQYYCKKQSFFFLQHILLQPLTGKSNLWQICMVCAFSGSCLEKPWRQCVIESSPSPLIPLPASLQSPPPLCCSYFSPPWHTCLLVHGWSIWY